MRIFSPAWIIVGLALMACGSDNGGQVLDGGTPIGMDAPDNSDGGGGCAVQPTFSSIHAGILRDVRCTVCHGAAPGLGNLFFPADKAAAYTTVMGNTLGGVPAKRVVAMNLEQSSLYLKLTPTPPFGDRMPQVGSLPACEIDAVRMWIMNGAAND